MDILELPPHADLLRDIEEHPEGPDTIRIEFYQTPEGKHFVWPYIRQLRKDVDSMKHFHLPGHFSTAEAARDAAISKGRELIATGFETGAVD